MKENSFLVSDEQLNTAEQTKVRALVKGLEEDHLSMTWRSELNSKLAIAAARNQRASKIRKSAWFGGLGLSGAVLTASFVLAMLSNQISPVHSTPSYVELELANVHDESNTLAAISNASYDLRESELAAEPGIEYSDLL